MTTTHTFPEVNALDIKDCTNALRLGYLNYNALAPAARPEFNARMQALRDRRRRLVATEAQIKAVNAALRRNLPGNAKGGL